MKHYLTSTLFFLILPFITLNAQSDDSWKLYDDTTLARIDITIDTASLRWIYQHVESDSEHYAQVRFRNRWIDESMDSIGFRLRGNTSRYSQKKSFKISFNSFIKGRRFHGVKKLNLNGEHNDPSIIRSKLCFDLYHDIGFPATRASHAKVYLNGDYYGLYISVEDVGEDFLTKTMSDDSGNLWKCLYPADLQYLGDDPAIYAALVDNNRPVYELQTNEDENDFSQLARLIGAVNNAPSIAMADSLESLLDVPVVLKYFAMNTLLGSWDDYRSLMNNYYLYYNPAKNQFTLIPYDYDNSFGVDWSGNNWTMANPYNFPKVVSGARPLAEALLEQDYYRDLFTHFLNFYSTNVMPLSRWESRIDRIRDTIAAAAIEDSFRTLDYGFTESDFYHSYTSSYQKLHVKYGIKQFVNLRLASLPAQLNYTNAPSSAYSVALFPEEPGGNDSIQVHAACFGDAGIKSVSVVFTPDDSTTPQSYPMHYSPVSGTLIAEEADRWVATLPPLGNGVRGTLLIRVTDSLNRITSYPTMHPITIRTPGVHGAGLFINEILADNSSVNTDPNGDHEDWIELYNSTDSTILLTGMYMTDNPSSKTKWRFTQPNLSIGGGEYLLIWCDDEQGETGIHTNFKLSAGGESAALVDTDGVTMIDSVTFGAQIEDIAFGRFPDGTNYWGMMIPSPGEQNGIVDDVQPVDDLPKEFSLTAFPNPFNPVTRIEYTLPIASHVTLCIYSINGLHVATLVDEMQSAGLKALTFDAKNLSSGVYFYKLEAAPSDAAASPFVRVKKLVLLK